jgi:hypothetical protein
MGERSAVRPKSGQSVTQSDPGLRQPTPGRNGAIHIEFAVRDGHQSGQRFLDSSDPQLRRHVASCEAAGGGLESLSAGKDEKLSREFEGRALIGREAPVPSLQVSESLIGQIAPPAPLAPSGAGPVPIGSPLLVHPPRHHRAMSSDPGGTPLSDLDDSQIAQLLEYVRILDRWDREAHGNQPR